MKRDEDKNVILRSVWVISDSLWWETCPDTGVILVLMKMVFRLHDVIGYNSTGHTG